MPLTIASDIARKSFGALLEKVEQNGDFSPDDVQELLAGCEIGSLVLDKLWRLADGFLDRGMEGTKLTLVLKEFVDVVELGIKTLDAAHERMKIADITPEEGAEGLSQLELQGRRAAEMHGKLSSVLRWLQAPPPAISLSSLPVGRGDREAEAYVDLKELNARLLSAGNA